MAAASVRIFLGAQQLPLIRLARGALDRRKRRAVSSGCGRSAAASLTLEVTWTLRLQGLKPYTSLADLYEFVRASIRVGRNSRISSLMPSRALCKARLLQREVASARTSAGRGLPSPAPRLRKKQASEAQTLRRRHQRSAPHRSATLCSAGSEAVSSGSPQGVAQSALLCNTTWSPRPQTHRRKQRHQLC
jgi:hypothetical protein